MQYKFYVYIFGSGAKLNGDQDNLCLTNRSMCVFCKSYLWCQIKWRPRQFVFLTGHGDCK